MKKLFTLLWLAIAAFTFKAGAQSTSCNADFTWQFVNGNTVKFTPVTNDSPLVHHDWNFGDGSAHVQQVSPTHSYAANGTYLVIHTIARYNSGGVAVCTQSITRTIIIQQAPPCTLVVDFSWTATAANPLSLEFHNLSVPLEASDSTTWTFGDGTTSYNANPVHTYANAGTYTVCLIVKKNNNSPGTSPCIRYICKTVVVFPPCTLVVDFSWSPTTSNPMAIQFTNLSTPLATNDSITWTFGDGSSSTALSPLHTYANAGTYTVCLRVKKVTPAGAQQCVREICKTIVIQAPCNLVVDFNWTITQTNPLRYEFHNLSVPLAATDSTIWSFGDGSGSFDVNPVHTYANAGTYTVCLIVKKYPSPTSQPCVRYICKTIVVQAPCTLVADFNWTITAANPLRYEFHNMSAPLAPTDSTIWTFGDGSGAFDVNPIHTYTHGGTYNVCLIVKKYPSPNSQPCIRYICKTITVQEPCTLVADFNWTITQTNPLRYEFHNLSVPLAPTDSTIWSFGDGSGSFDVNPIHTYVNAGTYNVCLIVKKYPSPNSQPCVRYICKTVIVQAPCNMVANFTWQPDAANTQKIYFTNTSTNLISTDSIRWTFGDGASSNLLSPDHTYAQAGTYNVCLRISRMVPAGTQPCVREICKTIVVQPTCNFQANFSWHLDSINVKKVYFTNLTVVSVASASVTWFFGDGTTATTWNAVHEYAQPGRYNVCLRVQLSPNCVRYKCDSITIPVPPPPCNNQSNFTFITASTNSQTFTFVPAFQSAAAVYTWTFGDGTGSHDMIATHHYAQPGTYTACLTVWRSATCASTSCRTVQVNAQPNCDSVHVYYTFQHDPSVPNKLYFVANSNFPILDQTWTIQRLPASGANPPVILHQNNPSYIFPDTGYYSVCLRAVTLGGCVKEYCSTIHITQVGTNSCFLQAYPNPASSIVYVNVVLTQPEMINAYMYNSLNVLVMQSSQQGNTGNNVVTFNVASLVPGMYTIKFIYGSHVCYAQFQKL